MKKIVLIISLSILSFANNCRVDIKDLSAFSKVCISNDLYILFSTFKKGGLTNTGYKCKCIVDKVNYVGIKTYKIKIIKKINKKLEVKNEYNKISK